ncbi:hypothetical protein [Longispora albida]|nr:hypothetical protein [Longispora albida]
MEQSGVLHAYKLRAGAYEEVVKLGRGETAELDWPFAVTVTIPEAE